MKRVIIVYKKHPFLYAVLGVFLLLIPTLFFLREKTNVAQRISQTTSCSAQTIACDAQFQENKSSACGAFKSLAVDNLISRDESPCKGMDRDFVSGELDKACLQGCISPTEEPVISESPTVTLTPTITQAPGLTSAPSATSVPMLTTTPTAGTSGTLTPSPVPATTIQVNFKYPGIGSGLSENTNPQNPGRGFGLTLFKDSTSPVPGYAATTTFDGNLFHGNVSVLEEGAYTIGLSTNGSLEKEIQFTILPGKENILPQVALTPGDVDQNNTLDIFDFNILVSCYADKPCAEKENADINDDGSVDSRDLNILLRSFALRI